MESHNELRHYLLYIREHSSYEDACKMGITTNLYERNNQYRTGELRSGTFTKVFEIYINCLNTVSAIRILLEIEDLLQKRHKDLHIQYDGGTEFYQKDIISMIEDSLKHFHIKYREISRDEIHNLVSVNNKKRNTCSINEYNRIKSKIKSQRVFHKISSKIIQYAKTKSTVTLKHELMPIQNNIPIPIIHQEEPIAKTLIHLQENDKGILNLTCGYGKTLISLFTIKKLGFNTILIGVPSILLLTQWVPYISLLFAEYKYLSVGGNNIDINDIKQFLRESEKLVIVTTYKSSYKIFEATKEIDFTFDIKVLDEVHHLTAASVSKEKTSKHVYIKILEISSLKQLSLTATLKELEDIYNDSNRVIISNNNIDIFGKVICQKNMLCAIREGIICDYVIQTIITDEEQLEELLLRFNIIDENDKRLFLSAYSALKSINDGYSHHLLIYSNSTENSKKILEYLNKLLEHKYFHIFGLYPSNYDSKMNSKEQKKIMSKFQESKFGIITCVYCLGEGWDCPLLDGVVFSENMASIIRILQSILRSGRKNRDEPNKINKIILPILKRDDWLENNDNPDLKKVREVIYQVGLEDETVTSKIKVYKINIEKQKVMSREKREIENIIHDFGEYDDELTNKLRLTTVRRTALSTTYEKARKIIASYENIKSKESYYELCERDNRLSKEPEIVFKGKFTNWIEYLSIERIYYPLETCKNKISEYLLSNPDLKKYYLELSIISSELCKIDALFPPNCLWVEYYGVNLEDIIIIKTNKKKMGILL